MRPTLGTHVERHFHREIASFSQILVRRPWLIKHKHLPAECRIELRLRKPEGTNTYCYNKAEVRAMLEHCAKDPELAWLSGVITALAFTGLRISELASLRWSDIDLMNRVLRLIDETASLHRNGREARTTKSGRGRSLPIRDELYAVLQSLPRMKDGYVFHGPRGGRLKPDLARRRLISEVLTPLEEQFPTPEGIEDSPTADCIASGTSSVRSVRTMPCRNRR